MNINDENQLLLKKIADFLYEYKYKELTTIGVSYGRTGVATFLLIYSKYYKNKNFYDKGEEIISNVIDDIIKGNLQEKRKRENLNEFGIFMEFAVKHKLLNIDTNSFLEYFDEFIFEQMVDLLEKGDYDVASGALSMGYYFISRYNSKEGIKTYLNFLLKKILEISKNSEKGHIYWQSTLFDGDRIYLGMHGSSQIILFCLKLYQLGIEKELCLEIIEKASWYMVENRIKHKKCFFPIVIGYPIERAPLEWAYGDLLVAYTLYLSGNLLKIDVFKNLAIQSFELASNRIEDSKVVVDAGLVHGTMGTALMFQKIYYLTKEEKYRVAAIHCSINAKSYFDKYDSPYLSYKAYYEIDNPGSHVSFYSGLAGIGTAIMGVSNNDFMYFDELLFM